MISELVTNSLTSDRYIYRSSGNYKIKGKYLDSIEGAVIMIDQNIQELAIRHRGFRLETFLPKRKAWIQTLILLPFGLPVGNFLSASWHFSVNSIVQEHQYLIGILSMAINLLLPSLFFCVLIPLELVYLAPIRSNMVSQCTSIVGGSLCNDDDRDFLWIDRFIYA